MVNMAIVLKVLWGCSLGLQLTVLFAIIAKKHYQTFPAILAYLLIGLLQSPLVYLTYSTWGFESLQAFRIAWTSQAIVTAARWIAVCELCHLILGQFSGIWGMTWRVLAISGAIALFLALLLGGHDYARLISTLDLGLECSMATVLVVFFLFARYYRVLIHPSLHSIAIAFCLYSCFRTVNDTILQVFLRNYSPTWNLVDEVTYLATLMLLASAVFALRPRPVQRIRLLPRDVYSEFVPQVNSRLVELNRRLSQLLKSEATGKT
jgi:hypothetical protein